MKIPFADYTCDGDFTNAADDSPRPYPECRYDKDEDPSIRPDVKNPSMFAWMPPIANRTETDEQGEEWYRSESEDAEQKRSQEEKRRMG